MTSFKDFSIHYNQNFQMRLPNGYVVSIGIGTTHYCSNKGICDNDLLAQQQMLHIESSDCEIAIIHPDGSLVTTHPYATDTNRRYVGFMANHEVLELIDWARSQPFIPASCQSSH
jgi:hypothetical protein